VREPLYKRRTRGTSLPPVRPLPTAPAAHLTYSVNRNQTAFEDERIAGLSRKVSSRS
jgi:hypothetical protein